MSSWLDKNNIIIERAFVADFIIAHAKWRDFYSS